MVKKELNKNKSVAGIILSGGLSRRMGDDKSKKKISGKTLLQLVLDRSKEQVDKIVLNSNKPINDLVIKKTHIEIIKDCISGNLGPLVGILSGIKWARKKECYNWLASFPIDSPFFPDDLVSKFLESSKNYDVLLAESYGRVHPVFSMWKLDIEVLLEESLNNGIRKIDEFTKKIKTGVVNFPDIGYDPFFNVNTLEDLKKAEDIFLNTTKG